MISLSKSKYCNIWQCPKIAWLKKYKPETFVNDAKLDERMRIGYEIGKYARQLFGDYVDVTTQRADSTLPDLQAMIKKTQIEISKNTNTICEASFSYNNLYCAVDILKKENEGYAIYEVKSSTDPDKDVYAADVAYQKYVLTNCGIKVVNTYIVCINNEYIFDGTLDLNQLFRIENISESVSSQEQNIITILNEAETILNSESEPDIDLDTYCNKPYKCGFFEYCTKDLCHPNVFDLNAVWFTDKVKLYKDNCISFENLCNVKIPRAGCIAKYQIEHYLKHKEITLDIDGIKDFLNKLSYPLYFLDFESMQPVIPQFINSKPYAQIVFQYSLHYLEKEEGDLLHKEFLAESGPDPRRVLAENLCKDIPLDVCTIVYNETFEKTRIQELADLYPDLKEHLLNIKNNIIDLLVPFRKGCYYKTSMGNSLSIKSVLPSLFPDDSTLNYHNLEGVHNGSEAMSIFPKIKDMEPEEKEQARHNLLKYCELDTLAMVKVWEELLRVTKDILI